MFKIFLFVSFLACALAQVHNVDDHCKLDCSHVTQHLVCGSDHKTYDNLCVFSMTACYYHEKHRGHLTIIHGGSCSGTHTTPKPVDHCNDLCNEDIEHVCGSDGNVYDNKCKFFRAQCEAAKMNQTIFIVAKGDICPQRRTPDCTQFNIDTSDLAFEDGTNYKPHCSSHREFVCANNGMTYTNECYLCSYMESHQVNLVVVNDDQCLH